MDVTYFFQQPCKATHMGNLLGFSKFGFTVTFEKEYRYLHPSEYNLPTESYLVSAYPRVVASFITVEPNVFDSAFGGLYRQDAGPPVVLNAQFPVLRAAPAEVVLPGHQTSGDAAYQGTLVIAPLYGTVGPTLTINACEAEFFDDVEINADGLIEMPLRFIPMNYNGLADKDWEFDINGTGSVASSTRMLEYAKILTYLSATFTTSTFIVSEPPETFLPGIPFPCIFMVEKSVDSIFQDKRVIRVRMNLNIYDWSASDPLGIDTNLRLNNLVTQISTALQSVKKNVTTFSINGRVTSVVPPTKRMGNEIQKAMITLELFINET